MADAALWYHQSNQRSSSPVCSLCQTQALPLPPGQSLGPNDIYVEASGSLPLRSDLQEDNENGCPALTYVPVQNGLKMGWQITLLYELQTENLWKCCCLHLEVLAQGCLHDGELQGQEHSVHDHVTGSGRQTTWAAHYLCVSSPVVMGGEECVWHSDVPGSFISGAERLAPEVITC
ncbi:hypothetical protein DV515_00010675 [Chloebia gouldiae]|uniref:Uncharacterized protein n=1 Tax=Chloebia gouldiae TaxID=44316 RepID=A0A3L8S996_CHLGU|nr:hypothetical protein DV515_00010675 [Chloebia gouldiae]